MSGDLVFRRAEAGDLVAIVALLADDELGRSREQPGNPAYARAFEAICSDPNQLLAVAVLDGQVIGTLQVSVMPGISLMGAVRGEIEGVRIAPAARGHGRGEQMIHWAVEQCRSRGCNVVQLTTNAARTDAQRFYERIGFKRSHVGFKLAL